MARQDGAAPDRPPRSGRADDAGADPVGRRPVVAHRLPAATQARSSRSCSTGSTTSVSATSSPSRCSSTSARTRERINTADIGRDPEATEIFRAARDGLGFLAAHLTLEEFFIGAQERGLGVRRDLRAGRGDHERALRRAGLPRHGAPRRLGRDVTYPAAPFPLPESPMRVTCAPRVGEHTEEVLAELRPT